MILKVSLGTVRSEPTYLVSRFGTSVVVVCRGKIVVGLAWMYLFVQGTSNKALHCIALQRIEFVRAGQIANSELEVLR